MAAPKSRTKAKAADTVMTEPAAEPSVSLPVLHRLVVCAYPGTGDQIARVWERMTGVTPKTVTVTAEKKMTDILAEIVADQEVADEFILVPANCVPCAPISMEELAGPFVFVDIQSFRHYNDRLPVRFSKELLVEELTQPEIPDDEYFMKVYYKKYLHRPIEGGFRFGNLVTPVYRANPCENLVVEAFVRKKFVTASPAGYKAIAHLVDEYLL